MLIVTLASLLLIADTPAQIKTFDDRAAARTSQDHPEFPCAPGPTVRGHDTMLCVLGLPEHRGGAPEPDEGGRS